MYLFQLLFQEASLSCFVYQEVCSAIAVLSCPGGLSSCRRTGNEGWLLLPLSQCEVELSSFFQFPTYFCHHKFL